MLIIGVSFLDDLLVDEAFNGASVDQNRDFSTLLFGMLAATSPQAAPLASVAESSPATVFHKDNANDEASSHQSTEILRGNIALIKKAHNGESYVDTNSGTEESEGHFDGTIFVPDMQFWQSIPLQPEAAPRDRVSISTTGPLEEDEKTVSANTPRNLWIRVADPLAEVDSLSVTTPAKPESATAPKQLFSRSVFSMDAVMPNLPPQYIGDRSAQTETAVGGEVNPGIPKVEQPETAALFSYSGDANEKQTRTISESADGSVSVGQLYGSVGYSLNAKDNVRQMASRLSRERTPAPDSGSKVGPQLIIHAESELHTSTASRTIDSIGESRSTEIQQEKQAKFFQHDDFEPSHKPFLFTAETLVETPLCLGVPFQVGYAGEDKAPRIARDSQNINWHPVIHRVIGEINGQIQIGKQEAILQLNPPELGKLRIDLHLDGDRLIARILTETQDARILIETHLPELRQALGESRVELVDVRIDSGSWTGSRNDGQQGARQETNGHRQTAHVFDSLSEESEKDEQARRSSTGVEGRVSMWA